MGAVVVNLALSLGAGLLTALSPCVLPALPIIVGSAASGRRYGPVALAAGLAVAFTIIGVTLAATGSVAGLSETGVRQMAAVMLLLAGVALLSTRVQTWMSRLASPLASRAATLSMKTGNGLAGQFAIGALLGAVWSPCVGPTLGAAVGLASTAGAASLTRATASMFAFGVGSALPLLATAYASRRMLTARGALLAAGTAGKSILGGVLVAMGALVLFGIDKQLEASVLAHLPQWWIDLLASV
ncbi:MAG: sulfite exporter TauE/SafE family protein [Acidobacteria bacterium]|nr:sulfite exporter TauE/SafE family protein [Acidobacteriota bacterium]